MVDDRYRGPWQYRLYPADLPSTDFGPLTLFVETWRAKCPSPGVFPRWRDFDLMDFEGWWGQISLAEMHYDPLDLRWALWGTMISNWWGADYTNKFISDIPAVREVWEHQERKYLERLLSDRLLGYVTGSLSPQARNFYHICGVDLPLENDGVITHVLSAYRLCDPGNIFVPPVPPVFEI